MSEKFEALQAHLKKMAIYGQAMNAMYWDTRTTMPKEGFAGRMEAIGFFSGESFRMSTSDEVYNLLVDLNQPEEYDALDEDWKWIVRKMLEDMERDRRVPADFYEQYVIASNESEHAWEEAKQKNDFSIFAPHLEKMIEMSRQMYAYTDPGKETYDAMLDTFEKGMDSATIDRIFGELKAELVPLVKKIVAAEQPDDSAFHEIYSADDQRRVQKLLLEYIGFDFNRGTVGETEHPFTMNFDSHDVRVTNHYYEDNVLSSMFSAIHEGGHAIFEQNVKPMYDNTVAGSCRYMGIHESQSRFYENVLGRNRNFWVPIYDKVQKELPKLSDVSLDQFYHEINHVRNSLVRTEADEVTYGLHIMIRYEIEKAIFRDNVKVADLPKLWNQKMEEYLGIVPPSDAEGILQDMHWSDGSFGYFPSYLLGSIYDGMYLDQITEELGDVDTILREGRISEITHWLNEKIHQYGSTRTPKEVLDAVCHKEVTAEPLVRYFKNKYTEIYHL